MSFNNIYDKKKLQEEANRADPNFGDGSFLLRPEDTSIQGASEDFMKYLNDPFAEVKQNIADDEIMDAAAPGREMFDQLKGNNTPDLPQALTSQSMSQESGMSSKGPKTGFTPPNTPPATIPQEDILAQLKAARAANETSFSEAKEKDASIRLANAMNKSFNKIGTGIANQAGYTKIASNPLEVTSDLAKTAASSNKERLDGLLQEYSIKKGIEDTKYSRDKDVTDRKDRLNARAEEMQLKRDEMNYKKKNDAAAKTLAKEEVKEGIQISKENRKVRRDLDESIPALESQLQNIKEAKAMLMDNPETKKTGVATGPLDQYYSKVTKEGQTLEKKLNKISLDTMVKMFSGMSKAVDTNAERAQFQSTQPQMSDYQDVNIDTLTKLENSINSVIKKTNAARQLYDRTGDFTQPEEKQSTVAPKTAASSQSSSYPKQLSNGKGKTVTVSNSQEESEAKSEGWN